VLYHSHVIKHTNRSELELLGASNPASNKHVANYSVSGFRMEDSKCGLTQTRNAQQRTLRKKKREVISGPPTECEDQGSGFPRETRVIALLKDRQGNTT